MSACQPPSSTRHPNSSKKKKKVCKKLTAAEAAARLTVRPGVVRCVPAELRVTSGPGNRQGKSPDNEEERERMFSSWSPTTRLSYTCYTPLPLPYFLLPLSPLPCEFTCVRSSWLKFNSEEGGRETKTRKPILAK